MRYARARTPCCSSSGNTVCQPLATATSAPYQSPKPRNTGACTGAKCSTTVPRSVGPPPCMWLNGSWSQIEHVCPIRSSRSTSWKMMLWPPDPTENGGMANATWSRSRSAMPGTGSSSGAAPVPITRTIAS